MYVPLKNCFTQQQSTLNLSMKFLIIVESCTVFSPHFLIHVKGTVLKVFAQTPIWPPWLLLYFPLWLLLFLLVNIIAHTYQLLKTIVLEPVVVGYYICFYFVNKTFYITNIILVCPVDTFRFYFQMECVVKLIV